MGPHEAILLLLAFLLCIAPMSSAAFTGPDLMRDACLGESWVDRVQSLHLRAAGKWTITPQELERRRSEIKQQFPNGQRDPKQFPGFALEQTDAVEIAFDSRRLYYRQDSFHGGVHDQRLSIWDGQKVLLYHQNAAQESYGLEMDPVRCIGMFLLAELSWPRAAPHSFWWSPQDQPEALHQSFGQPDDYRLAGRENFRGTECHAVEREQMGFWRRLYLGVDDHRVYGLSNLSLPRSRLEAVFGEVTRGLAPTSATRQEAETCLQSLPSQRRAELQTEFSRRVHDLRDRAVPSMCHWLADYQEVAPGCWLPMTQGNEFWRVDAVPEPHWASRREVKLTQARVDEPLPDSMFQMQFKEGVDVCDACQDPPARYKYKKDPAT